jgi:VIT1/CCC1 family predicted Fe2+/Mn2+ transporter
MPADASSQGSDNSAAGKQAEQRYRANLQGEVDGAAVYLALAESEKDPKLAEVFRRLAAVEQAHGAFWQNRIGTTRRPAPSMRARVLAWLARRFGPGFVIPTLAAAEVRDSAGYDNQPEARAAGLPLDERSHARLMAAIAGPSGVPGPTLALVEGRHRGGGNSLRAAVLGANDGLVSNLSLVMGVAGAVQAEQTLLLTGLAGLLAGACSMAMGEWLSVTSSRELYAKQIATEAEELRQVPDEEKEELVLIYQAKGIDEAQARALSDRLLSDKNTALDTLAREELGIDPDELGGSAWQAAGWSFVLFSAGAIVPVAPFFVLTGTVALAASAGASGLALMLVGAGTSLFTGRSAIFSALRQLAIGLAAAAVTYVAGAVVGASLS